MSCPFISRYENNYTCLYAFGQDETIRRHKYLKRVYRSLRKKIILLENEKVIKCNKAVLHPYFLNYEYCEFIKLLRVNDFKRTKYIQVKEVILRNKCIEVKT